MRSLLRRAKEAGIDAVIASDMACIAFCREIGLSVHISTQLSLSNLESLRFYAAYADVAVLARELDLAQVRQISDGIREEGITGPAGQPAQGLPAAAVIAIVIAVVAVVALIAAFLRRRRNGR